MQTAPAAAVALVLALAVPAASAAAPLCGTLDAPPAVWEHVVWIWFENHGSDQVIGSPDAPFMNRTLAAGCGLATNAHNETHPSLPNYIAATSGLPPEALGRWKHDCNAVGPCRTRAANLFAQAPSWAAYAESMPKPCVHFFTGLYAASHNPAVYYRTLTDCPAHDVPYGQLQADLDADTLPPSSGLQCPANEDDNIPLTQGLQGAETGLLALQSGAAAAGACGFDPGEVATWQARAAKLAIRDHFFVPGPPAHFEGGRPAWLLWPTGLLAPGDPLALSHAAWLKQTAIDPILNRTALNGGYNAESLLARAALFRALGDTAVLAEIQDEVRFFIKELTTPGTLHLSEFYARVPLDLNGDGVAPDYLPENDVPHVWEHAYLYTAAMVAFGSR